MTDVVIVAAGRTAVGSFNGTLAKLAAADLGAHVIRHLLAKSGIALTVAADMTDAAKKVVAAARGGK